MTMTYLGILLLLALAIIGVPLYLAILAGSFFIMVVHLHIPAFQPLEVMFSRTANYNLLAIPLFIFVGSILSTGGAGKSLVKLLNSFMGHIPGGPAYALVFASVIVAAICAHPMAAIAGFGPLIVPIMVSLGYSETFSIGLLIASASLAPLIPPSTMTIIYTIIANPITEKDIEISTLWTACVIPGLLIALLLCITVFIYTSRGHYKRLPAATWADRWEGIKEAWPVAITPLIILGPLYANWANATEVGAIGVLYMIVISAVFYHSVSWKSLWMASMSTLRILGAVFVIIMASLLLSNVITRAQLPQEITNWISDLGLEWWSFILVIFVLFFILGCLLDPTAIILIAVPMLLTTAEALGINVYVLGVFTCVAVTLAGITPPYGLTIFAAQSILQKPYHTIVKACLIFLPALILGNLLVGLFEPLTTWLPNLID
jgi:C4-dicarboxylate transporter DctM subunit